MYRLTGFVLFLSFNYAFSMENATVAPKQQGTCGITKGGQILQKITVPVAQSSGLIWNEKFGPYLFFVDRYSRNLYQWEGKKGTLEFLPFPVDKEIVSVHPIRGERKRFFIVGTETSLYLLNQTSDDYKYSRIMKVITEPNMVLMKGKTDSLGRLWYTTSYENNNSSGKLLKVAGKNNVVVMESDLKYPKGLAWCKDSKKFYLVDMDTKLIYEYDFNLKAGTIGNKKVVFDGKKLFPLGGYPTDVTVDRDGYLWIGIAGVGQVIKYDVKSGKILRAISIPSNHITSLEFGLYKYKNLFVGTRRLPILSEPDSGSIFGISGLKEQGFADNEAVIPK